MRVSGNFHGDGSEEQVYLLTAGGNGQNLLWLVGMGGGMMAARHEDNRAWERE